MQEIQMKCNYFTYLLHKNNHFRGPYSPNRAQIEWNIHLTRQILRLNFFFNTLFVIHKWRKYKNPSLPTGPLN